MVEARQKSLAWIWPWLIPVVLAPVVRAEPPPGSAPVAERVSFLRDVAPVLVKNCVACHNARKAESKYDLTTFTRLARGGQQGEGVTLEPGEPGESRLVELIRLEGQPRMPYKLAPLPQESVSLIERWVSEGARYDGENPDEDWLSLLHKRSPVVVPERYPVAVPVSAVAFSPDGHAVATSGQHEVNLWSTEDGSLRHRLRGVAERVHDIEYSPDGKWLATASGDPGQRGAVALWAAEPDGSGRPVRDLLESNDSVFAVAFSPDSTRVAAAGTDRAVRVWEVATGKLLTTIEDHADWVLDLAFSPDGRLLATASRDRSGKVFDLARRETLATFSGHADTVYSVAFRPDGKAVATGGADGLVRVWDPSDGARQSASLGGFKGAVFRVRYSNDGRLIVASSADRTARVFEGGSPRFTLTGQADWLYALDLAPGGDTLATGSWDGQVRLWSLTDGRPITSFLAAPGLTRGTLPGQEP